MAASPTVRTLLRGFPFGCDHGHIAFCHVVLVEGPDATGRTRRIVYDLGHAGRREVLWAALGRHGLRSEDVDLVVVSHVHWDHIQNVDVFDQAAVLLHPDELRYAHDPHPSDHATPRWTAAILERQRIRATGEGDELIPGVRVVELPGHSCCCLGLVVETDAGSVLLTSDAVQTAGVALAGRNPIVFWDVDAADRSVRRCRDLAEVLYPGHDRPFRLTGDHVHYLEPFAATLLGLDADQPGLAFGPGSTERFVMPGIADRALRPMSHPSAASTVEAG